MKFFVNYKTLVDDRNPGDPPWGLTYRDNWQQVSKKQYEEAGSVEKYKTQPIRVLEGFSE